MGSSRNTKQITITVIKFRKFIIPIYFLLFVIVVVFAVVFVVIAVVIVVIVLVVIVVLILFFILTLIQAYRWPPTKLWLSSDSCSCLVSYAWSASHSCPLVFQAGTAKNVSLS